MQISGKRCWRTEGAARYRQRPTEATLKPPLVQGAGPWPHSAV